MNLRIVFRLTWLWVLAAGLATTTIAEDTPQSPQDSTPTEEAKPEPTGESDKSEPADDSAPEENPEHPTPVEILEAELITKMAATNQQETVTNTEPSEPMISAEKAWRSFMQIQGQLDTALMAIERNRRESESTNVKNQDKIDEGLKSIERVLQTQQEQEIQALHESNRNMLIVAGAFAGVGFLAMFLTSLFHFRAMNRMASIAASLPSGSAFASGHAGLLDAEQERMLEMNAGGDQAGSRLLTAIERLEKRVNELEHTADTVDTTSGNAQLVESVTESGAGSTPSPEDTEIIESTNGSDVSLVAKGQTLLNLGRAEEALQCFNDVLNANGDDAETLVKKGTALEKLNRLDEAIECYDRAITVNESMTLAYLYKGGLFNRLERYNEALACYEQALKTQQAS